jgi:hypothetical protein
MNISTAAGFLINRAVRMASGLQQESKGNASRSAIPAVRAKTTGAATDAAKTSQRGSAAYRVSLSSSALQKGAMESISA